MSSPSSSIERFDAQVDRLVALGYARAARLTQGAFRRRLARLGPRFVAAARNKGEVPPVLVVARTFVPAAKLIEAIARTDGKPQTVIGATELAAYRPIDALRLPDADAWVLSGIALGGATRGDPPAVARKALADAGRTPLTIEEGLALHTHIADVIGPNRGLSLSGSTRGDRRVPALWISKGTPKLGWCYVGAPHTWLGTPSCAARFS